MQLLGVFFLFVIYRLPEIFLKSCLNELVARCRAKFFGMFGGFFSLSTIPFSHFQKWNRSCLYGGYHFDIVLGEFGGLLL
jgi:hypothetical protein